MPGRNIRVFVGPQAGALEFEARWRAVRASGTSWDICPRHKVWTKRSLCTMVLLALPALFPSTSWADWDLSGLIRRSQVRLTRWSRMKGGSRDHVSIWAITHQRLNLPIASPHSFASFGSEAARKRSA